MVDSSSAVEVVLFDLGGVLVELTGVQAMGQLSGIHDDDELWRRWLSCAWVAAFERGECSADDFAAGVVDDWGLNIRPEEYLRSFQAWPGGPLDGASQLIDSLKGQVKVACLSTTNRLHWDRCSKWPLMASFHERFLSFELGLVKPDPAIFERVLGSLAVEAGKVLFLDDNIINTDAAAQAGLRARRVVGPTEARAALVDEGVLDQTRRKQWRGLR